MSSCEVEKEGGKSYRAGRSEESKNRQHLKKSVHRRTYASIINVRACCMTSRKSLDLSSADFTRYFQTDGVRRFIRLSYLWKKQKKKRK